MKYKILSTLFISAAVFMSSCSSWLDVDPTDKILEDKLYETETGINTIVNGFYMGMAKDSLYGEVMTSTVIELLGQQYYTISLSSQNSNGAIGIQFSGYDYTQAEGMKIIENVWSAYYSQIFEINTFLNKIQQSTAISDSKKAILSGEAYGLRAFLHFDLLRLYGPVYSENPDSESIPYNNTADASRKAKLPASEIITNVLADIDRALTLLANDPIIENGVLVGSTQDPISDFYRFRNRRMNYFAVKALKARVLLYKGDVAQAGGVASELISNASLIFPWASLSDFQNNKTPDRIFSSEVIFGIESNNMYTNWSDFFSPVLKESGSYWASKKRLMDIFNMNTADYNEAWYDYRSYLWRAANSQRTSYKFQDAFLESSYVRMFQPLIRISEMYYIKAEAALVAGNVTEAIAALDEVRTHRGWPVMEPTSTATEVEQELEKEYYREFYGEGQMFFYFKRKNKSQIMGGNETSVTMTSSEYVIPIPLIESTNK